MFKPKKLDHVERGRDACPFSTAAIRTPRLDGPFLCRRQGWLGANQSSGRRRCLDPGREAVNCDQPGRRWAVPLRVAVGGAWKTVLRQMHIMGWIRPWDSEVDCARVSAREARARRTRAALLRCRECRGPRWRWRRWRRWRSRSSWTSFSAYALRRRRAAAAAMMATAAATARPQGAGSTGSTGSIGKQQRRASRRGAQTCPER